MNHCALEHGTDKEGWGGAGGGEEIGDTFPCIWNRTVKLATDR